MLGQEAEHRPVTEPLHHAGPAPQPLRERLVDPLAVAVDVTELVAHRVQHGAQDGGGGGVPVGLGDAEGPVHALGRAGVIGAPHADTVDVDPGAVGGTSLVVDVDVVETPLLQAELVDQLHHQGMAAGNAHRARLGVLAGIGEGLLGVFVAAVAEGLDASARAVAVGLQHRHPVTCPLQQPGSHQPGRTGADDQDVLRACPPLSRQALFKDALVARDEGAVVGVQYEQRPSDGQAPVEVGATAGAGGGRGGPGRGDTAGQGRRNRGRAGHRREAPPGEAAV